MKLIIARHGETIENQKGILQGHLPGTLSENGINQAKEVALKLKDTKIDYVYSSDLKRCTETAKEIMKYHNCPFELTKELRERYLAELQGKSKKSLGHSKETSIAVFENHSGETRKEMFDRAKRFLEKIKLKHKDQTILIVSHNGINKAIISAINGTGAQGIPEIPNMTNDEIKEFDLNS